MIVSYMMAAFHLVLLVAWFWSGNISVEDKWGLLLIVNIWFAAHCVIKALKAKDGQQ